MGVGGVVAMVVVVVVVGEADGVVVVVEDVAVGVVVAVVVVLMVMEAAVVVVFLGAGAEVEVDVAIPAVAVLMVVAKVVVDEAIPAGGDVEMVVVLGNSRLSLSQNSAGSQCLHVTGSVGESQYSDFRMNHAPIVVEHLLDTDYYFHLGAHLNSSHLYFHWQIGTHRGNSDQMNSFVAVTAHFGCIAGHSVADKHQKLLNHSNSNHHATSHNSCYSLNLQNLDNIVAHYFVPYILFVANIGHPVSTENNAGWNRKYQMGMSYWLFVD